jgi:hypothetical protein
MGEAMRVIRQFVVEMEAQVARSVLEAHGIPAVVLRDNAGGMLPALQYLYPVRLAVRAQDAHEALRLLDSPFDPSTDTVRDADGPGLSGLP